jgi:MFS family permease
VFGPALTAAVPAIVPRSQFTAANALLQSTTSLGIIFGPALSGLGIAAYGSQEVLCLNAATYLISAGCLLLVRFANFVPGGRHVAAPTTMMKDLIEGFRFAFVNQRLILLLTGTAALYSFGTSALTALFPVFARKLLGLGPVEVGYLWSALGVGLLITSIGLVWITEWDLMIRTRLVVVTSVASGAAICVLAWNPDPYQAGILCGIIGGGIGALTPIAWGVIQELAPRHLVGRVLGLYGTGAMMAAIAGITAFGWITERYGPQTGLLGIGVVLFTTALSAYRMTHGLRRS